MLAPAVLYFLIFKYIPMVGLVFAFQDYNIFDGVFASEWVGFKWFEQFFTMPQSRRVLGNTLIINLYQLFFTFPAPIILACLLNELRHVIFKRIVQTVAYLPHFFSWTIIYGIAFMLLSTKGVVNQAVIGMGGEAIPFLQKPELFRSIIISSQMWKETGWSAIIFLAALSGISPSLYEAAQIDGAGRWQQFMNITLPGLMPAIMIVFLLNIGNIMDLGFEHIWVFLNPLTYATGDVLETFTYRVGIGQGMYSFTTAIGLFKSLIGLIMVVLANTMSKRLTGESIY
ncbi:sugar ABC transporter permease [Paenibacillus sp. IB182496]|uniref:Sugar ABC transporter permease n=1 Tax=Paenibacillus sabuli TaxID=2772509 RepID=A0A927BT68_9BACL|nr:sugar ABC transporter permease [Paenibacillus sabuli]